MISIDSKTKVILASHSDWDKWIEIVKTIAIRGDVWEYLNPALDRTKIRSNLEPVRPMPSDIKTFEAGRIAKFSDLDADEKEEFRTRQAEYQYDLKKYDARRVAMGDVRIHIQESIATWLLPYTFDKDTSYDMLISLKAQCEPTDTLRERELVRDWIALQTINKKTTDLDHWLTLWETTYDKSVLKALPDVQGTRPVYDFLEAISKISPDFTAIWTTKLASGEDVKMKPLLETYRNYRRTILARRQTTTHTAFAADTAGNNNTSSEPTLAGKDGKDKKPPAICICGTEHFWRECPYIHPNLRTKGWSPKKDIQKKVDEEIEKRPWIKNGRRRLEKKTDDKKTDQAASSEASTSSPSIPTSFMASIDSGFSATSSYELAKSTILDSGATAHICNDRSRFIQYTPETTGRVLRAGTQLIPIEGFGTTQLFVRTDSDTRIIELVNVIHISTFHVSVAALRKFVDQDVHWDTQNKRLVYKGRTFCLTPMHFDQWVLDYQPIVRSDAFPAIKSSAPRKAREGTLQQWHQRMGHLNLEAVRHLPDSTEGVEITPSSTASDEVCEVCRLTNATHQISRRPQPKSTVPYERVSYDLIQIEEAIGLVKYIAHFLCGCTSMKHVYPLTDRKQETQLNAFKHMNALTQRQWGVKIKFVRLDNESGLQSEFDEWTSDEGIIVERSAPDTQEQNGGSERSGGVMIRRSTAFRTESGLPKQLEPEAFKAAAYLLNRSPMASLKWKTPWGYLHELLGKLLKPRIVHLYTYGCRAYVLINDRPKLDRTEPRARIGYLVGYESTNIYRIWIPSQKTIVSTRDVTFDESKFYDASYNDQISEQTTVPTTLIPSTNVQPLVPEDTIIVDIGDYEVPTPPTAPSTAPSYEAGQKDTHSDEPQQMVTPSPSRSPEPQAHQQSEHLEPRTETTLARRTISSDVSESNIIEGGRRTRRTAYDAHMTTPYSGLYAAFTAAEKHNRTKLHQAALPPPPKHWGELEHHAHGLQFRSAAEVEWKKLEAKGTFTSVRTEEATSNPLPLMWVFTYKTDQDGYLVKHKARIVVRGDLQPPTYDISAVTLAVRIFRFIMALAAWFNLDIYQFDVITAFVNATLDEDVFVRCPTGFGPRGSVLRLLRALYGLRRSPLLWYRELSSTLRTMGLNEVPEALCLFISKHLIVFFYVDDICILCHPSHRDEYVKLRTKLVSAYELRELNDFEWFLGIRIVRNRDEKTLWLSQDAYIEKIARMFHLEDKVPAKTPMSDEEITPYEGTATPQEIFAYQQRIGCVNYPSVITRPDISYACGRLGEYLTNPGPEHKKAAERIITYLYGTRKYSIMYSGKTLEHCFKASSDASYGDDSLTRKSTEGYLFSLFGGPIDWKSAKQKTVTKSTTEAELLALSKAASELYWWQRLFVRLELELNQEYTMNCDNLQTVRLMLQDAPKLVTRLRHVDIHNHWLRQEVQNRRLKVQWIQTNQMEADGLTKSLPRQKHEHFVRMLNLQNTEY